MVREGKDNTTHTDPTITPEQLLGLLQDYLQGAPSQGNPGQQLAGVPHRSLGRHIPDLRSRGGAPVKVRSSWLLWRNKQDQAMVDVAKVIEELPVLLGRYYTNYAKLAVLLHQLFNQANLRMAEAEYGLPDSLLTASNRVAQTNMDILEEANEEVMTLFGDAILFKLTKALYSK